MAGPGPGAVAVLPPASLPPPPPAAAAVKQASHDRRFGMLAAVLWAGTAWRMAPSVTPFENWQSLAGIAAIVGVSLLWPALHPRSYGRHRTAALAALRLFLFALPFNYKTHVLDAICPLDRDGLQTWAVHMYNLLMGTHAALLLFSSLGWRLPLRAHLATQTAAVALLARFGVHAHCQTQLLASPQTQALVAGLHSCAGFASSIFVPFAPPALTDSYLQTITVLLFFWGLVGWLVPTLLLLPPGGAPPVPPRHTPQQAWRQRPCGAAAAAAAQVERLAAVLEAGLCKLLEGCSSLRLHSQVAAGRRPAHAVALRWFLVLMLGWQACCAMALLYEAGLPA